MAIDSKYEAFHIYHRTSGGIACLDNTTKNKSMAFQDYWSLFCPLAIESGFNVSLNPNMTANPNYLNLYNGPEDPIYFQPVFNCPEDFGEPGPHIAVRLYDEGKTTTDYIKYILSRVSIEKAAEKTLIEEIQIFKGYIWKPMPYDLATVDWQQIPQAAIDEWLNWQLGYLEKLKALFFHEKEQ